MYKCRNYQARLAWVGGKYLRTKIVGISPLVGTEPGILLGEGGVIHPLLAIYSYVMRNIVFAIGGLIGISYLCGVGYSSQYSSLFTRKVKRKNQTV